MNYIDISGLIKIDRRLRNAGLALRIMSLLLLIPTISLVLYLVGAWRPLAAILATLPILWALKHRKVRRSH